jgi:cell division protein FtsB
VKREDAAGRGPGAKRPTPSRTQRSRAASPTRREPSRPNPQREGSGRGTTLTARAAVLVLAVALVIVAVAVPFKIWLGQRSDISSLLAQTRQTELRLGKLNAQHKKWQQPSYIESQAHQRLHYVMPGQTTHIMLGRSSHTAQAVAARRHAAVTDGPWYSQFWQSVQTAAKPPAVAHTKSVP